MQFALMRPMPRTSLEDTPRDTTEDFADLKSDDAVSKGGKREETAEREQADQEGEAVAISLGNDTVDEKA